MRFLIISTILLLGTLSITGQDKISKRKEYKEFKSMTFESRCDSIDAALALRQWIVEGEKIPGRRGSTITVQPNAYFVAVNGNELIVATGSENPEMQSTFSKGIIEKYKISPEKDSSLIKIDIMAESDGNKINVSIEVSPCGNVAWTVISGKKLRRHVLMGHVIPINYSAVFNEINR